MSKAIPVSGVSFAPHNPFPSQLSVRCASSLETIPSILLSALIDGKPLAEPDVRDLAAQLVLSVGLIHDNSMVHCGLHPEILSLDWKGILKIIDYSSCEV